MTFLRIRSAPSLSVACWISLSLEVDTGRKAAVLICVQIRLQKDGQWSAGRLWRGCRLGVDSHRVRIALHSRIFEA